MKKLLLLLAAGHCFACCKAAPLHPKRVIITGTLVHAQINTPRVMVVNFLNPFIKGRKSAGFDEHNRLSVSEEMVFTQNMTIQYNDVFINLYVQPGDSLHIEIDGSQLQKKNFEWLTISGDHASLSDQLNKWHLFGSKMPYKKYDMTVSPSAMLDTIRMDYAGKKAVLEQYAIEHSLDPVVKNWALQDIKYSIGNWIMDYLTMKSADTAEQHARIALFAQTFFDQYNASNFQSMMFPYHLSAYAYAVMSKESSIKEASKQGRYADAAKAAAKLLLHEPAGLPRDYMLFSFLAGFVSRSPQLLDSLPAIAGNFSDPIVYSYLKEMARSAAHPDFPETPIAGISYLATDSSVQALPVTDLFRYLTNRYPGKILYIEIFATWCVPCLQEMTFLPAAKERLKGKDVVFINLCLQSEEASWKKLISERQLHGEHYLLVEDASRLFMGQYRVGGFPAYMIVNKKGKILTANAPRPSELEQLVKYIDDTGR